MEVNRTEFLRKLEMVTPGLSAKDIVEQSSCFVFRAGEVLTYNDEVSCRASLEVDELEGVVTAKPLLEILRRIPDERVSIFIDGDSLVVKGAGKKTRIRTHGEMLLPIDSIEQPEYWLELPPTFQDAASFVLQCTSRDETKMALVCVHMHTDWLEATDTIQAARWTLPLGISESVLVRGSVLSSALSLGVSQVGITSSWIHFKGESVTISCRRYIDEFPNIDKVFAPKKGMKITLPKGLASAAGRADVFSSEISDGNTVTVILKEGKVRVVGEGTSGDHTEWKKLAYEGEAISFLISPDLLSRIVESYDSCRITENRLITTGDSWTYVASLGSPNGKE